MALNTEYTIRETLTNLRRNLLMTTAAVITVAVSLALVGGALLLREAVDNATLQWRGGIEFSIYMQPDSTEFQRQAIETELSNNPQVEDVRFVSQAKAYEEFREMFRETPEYLESVTPEILPPSYRVVPRDTDDADAIEALGRTFNGRPGVDDVVFARDTAAAILNVSNVLQLGILTVAIVLLLAAVLLILNTIRLAIYARRREIEVMKLVGATNWFIRIPFMLEGMVHGVVGAGVAVATLAVVYNYAEAAATRNAGFFQNFTVADGTVLTYSLLLIGLGAAIGAIGSGTAVTRFLDV